MIRIKKAKKSFGEQIIFDDLTLDIHKPGLYVIWGKSGCGKSTLLNIIAGYDTFDLGSIQVDAEVMTIFQNYELIEELNVYDNIFLTRKKKPEDEELLKKLGINFWLKQYPNELSGGQKQRVGIARALIAHPKIICCDEPTESLDIENKQIVLNILKEYARDHIVIMATHQKDAVISYADYVLKFEGYDLRCYKRNGDIPSILSEEQKRYPKKKGIHQLIYKIISKKNRLFLCITMLFLVVIQACSILKQQLFYIPDTHHVLNADMIYLDTDHKDTLNTITNVQPILSFSNLIYQDIEYQTNIYPYIDDNTFQIEGESSRDLSVVINQNLANEIFGSNWKNQELSLTLMISPYTYSIDVDVVGVIQEDTSSFNIYYSLDSMMSYINEITLSDGRPLSQYYNETNTFYQCNVGYDHIEEISKTLEDNNVSVTSPLYDERETKEQTSMIYQYLFTAIIIIILILFTIYNYLISVKETKYYLKSFVILLAQKLPLQEIKKQYILQKMLPMILLSVVDCLILIVIHILIPHIHIIPLIGIVVLENFVMVVGMCTVLKTLKRENISTMIKENI